MIGLNLLGVTGAPASAAIDSAATSACCAAMPPCLTGKAVASPAAIQPANVPAGRASGTDDASTPGGAGRTTGDGDVRRGVGFAVGFKNLMYAEGYRDGSTARCRLVDGLATVTCAAAEVGQGFVTLAQQIARTILGVPIHDLTGGFKCIHRRVLEGIELETVRAEGYVFQIEVTYRAMLAGFRVTEVPIVFRDRSVGTSKMSTRIALEAMWAVPLLRRSAPAAVAHGRAAATAIETPHDG